MIKKCNYKDTLRKPPHRVKKDPLMHLRVLRDELPTLTSIMYLHLIDFANLRGIGNIPSSSYISLYVALCEKGLDTPDVEQQRGM